MTAPVSTEVSGLSAVPALVDGARPPTRVTSSSLAAEVKVASRWFPKVRSWLALGAPMELLSALSVARVLAALWAVWSLVVLPLSMDSRWVLWSQVGVTVLSVCMFARLLRLTVLDRRGLLLCLTLLVFASFPTALDGGGLAADTFIYAIGIPVCVVAGIFLGFRWAAAATLTLAVQGFGASYPEVGLVGALIMGVSSLMSLGTVNAAIYILQRGLSRSSTTDAETGLLNGTGIERWIAAHPSLDTFMLGSITVEGVAEVQETLGHVAGRELLRRTVEDLGQVVPKGSVIGRVDCAELVLVCPLDVSSDDGCRAAAGRAAERVAADLLEALSLGTYVVAGLEVSLGGRIGLVTAPWDGSDIGDLLRRAISSGRMATKTGQVLRRWDADRDSLSVADLGLLASLRGAAGREELRMVYQPQVDARSQRVVAVEALMRWDHPTLGPVSPGRFIPLAERTGLIDKLSDWSLDEVLDAQARWRAQGIEAPVAFNLSARELLRPELALRVLEKLRSRGLPGESLTVEITETAAATVDVDEVKALLEPLRSAGVRVSIDDFGSGYTALGVLPHLPLDELKIDLAFVQRAMSSPADAAIVRSVADLAHRMGLAVVAEGVEDETCADLMQAMGCDVLQGYHFARPLPEDDVVARLGALSAGAGPAAAVS